MQTCFHSRQEVIATSLGDRPERTGDLLPASLELDRKPALGLQRIGGGCHRPAVQLVAKPIESVLVVPRGGQTRT